MLELYSRKKGYKIKTREKYREKSVLIAEMLSTCPAAAARARFAESANVPMVEKKCQNWDTTLRLKKEMINGNINTRISR